MASINEIELYQLVLQKDSKALEILYDRYEKLLFSFVYRMTSDAQMTEEVIQEVFIKLWKNHAPYSEEKGKFSSWLLMMTRNTALDLLRKQTREVSSELMEKDSLGVHSETPEDIVEWKEKGSIIRRAISVLKDDQKKMIDLFYFKGLTHQKISDMTHLPLGTVKGRIRLALKHLKSHLESEGGKLR